MLACCIIHNHIMRVDPYDFLMEEICSESEPINCFRSIDGKSFWSYETQLDVMLACCIIHNHIIRVYPYDFLMEEICSESEPINQFKSTAGKGRE